MSSTPNDSAIKLNASLEEKVFNAKTSYEIGDLLRQAACDQGLCKKDIYSPDILIPLEQPAPGTPTAFVKTVTTEDGVRHSFEGATDGEASEKLLAFVRQRANEPAERPRDSESGRFVARTDDDPVAKADLEIKLRTGQITTEQYLAESGAIERHLEANGVSIEALQAATAERTTASWQQATQEFLASSDYPGGEGNLKLMSDTLIAMNATDYPSVENLRRAYEYLKSNNKLLPNRELEAVKAIGEATTPEQLRAAAMASQGRSGNMFNR